MDAVIAAAVAPLITRLKSAWAAARKPRMPNEPASEPDSTLDFAASEDEAQQRFGVYEHLDPFPSIPPALLNSADIADYVAAVGLIHPFHPEDLKGAAYRVRLDGDVVFWNRAGKRVERSVIAGERFCLEQNSIAFVTLEPTFRLPDYIALRFNLKIPLVYRGLLLGTGPLVDPGWTGRLSIPLHNLTTNDYWFSHGETIIWIEFTKLSPHSTWDRPGDLESPPQRGGKYARYPVESRWGSVQTRVFEAAQGREVTSSLGKTLRQADRAQKSARRTRQQVTLGGGLALLIAFVTIIALVAQVRSLKQQPGPPQVSTNQFQTLQREVARLQKQLAKTNGHGSKSTP